MPNPLKILVADDHRLFIEGIASVLQREANIQHIVYAENGKEAIEKSRQDIALVLMDINMPVLDGLEATAEIRRQNADIRILMLSMLADFTNVSKALKAGANGYILKTADHSELLTAIMKVMRGEVYLSPPLARILNYTSEVDGTDTLIRKADQLVTPREQSILKLIVEGKTDGEISGVLNISDKTVSTHRKNMLAKLGLRNTAQLVKFAMDNALV